MPPAVGYATRAHRSACAIAESSSRRTSSKPSTRRRAHTPRPKRSARPLAVHSASGRESAASHARRPAAAKPSTARRTTEVAASTVKASTAPAMKSATASATAGSTTASAAVSAALSEGGSRRTHQCRARHQYHRESCEGGCSHVSSPKPKATYWSPESLSHYLY